MPNFSRTQSTCLVRKFCATTVAAALAVIAAHASAETFTGPSSSASPYIVNVQPAVHIVSILTVGDSVNKKPDGIHPYRMVGIPDGLGAYDNGDETFTVLMNHELGSASGVARQHGSTGAFISQWIIRKSDLRVLHGGDLIKQMYTFVPATGAYTSLPGTTALGRLCSADLPAQSALYNTRTGKGYSGRIFLNGEENGPGGRAFAHVATGPNAGISYELPDMGKSSWENILASPFEQDKTVVIGLNDTTGGQLSVYIGEKHDTGTEIEKAGLRGGALYAIAVKDIASEDRDTGIPSGTTFTLAASGTATGFLRPEDGAWDTQNPNVFYFVTTDRYDSIKDPTGTPPAQKGRSRLYALTFRDIRDPSLGGRIDQLVDGSGPNQMFDNITVDGGGNVLIQEDPGNQKRSASIWMYSPSTGRLIELAKHDPARFGDSDGAAPRPPFNSDEESSGIIEITHLLYSNPQNEDRDGKTDRDHEDPNRGSSHPSRLWPHRGYRYFLGDVQAHYSPGDPELVEGGQLFLMAVPK